ncbi:MAG: hypothetical protein AAF628_27565 [Planctomycetota bacterium]
MIEVRGAPCGGGFTGYGAGLAGAGGFEPTLSGDGCPIPGSAVTVHIGSVVGAAGGALLIGAAPTSAPLFGGTILVVPALSLPQFVGGTPAVPGAGFAELGIGLAPNLALSGAAVYLQAVFVDGMAPVGVSFTGGLQLVIG